MVRASLCVCLCWFGICSACVGAAPLYILQANDPDPTSPTSQPAGRWYHWLGCDPAVTHLETGLAVDAAAMAGRGQRIRLASAAAVAAIQVKVKRIGQPGPLCWEAGTAWGRDDLGHGQVAAHHVPVHYERFVTLAIRPTHAPLVFLRLRAATGRAPDDYYAVYCTWRENHPQKVLVNAYDGKHAVGMMFRALRNDPYGEALESDGRPVGEGASMMTRLLSGQAGGGSPATFARRGRTVRLHRSAGRRRRPAAGGPSLARPKAGSRRNCPRQRLADPGGRAAQPGGRYGSQRSGGSAPPPDAAVDRRGLGHRGPGRAAHAHAGRRAELARRTAEGGRLSLGRRSAADSHPWPRRARGVLRGVWYLEDLMLFRGGPFVKRQAITREPRDAAGNLRRVGRHGRSLHARARLHG